MKKVEMRCVLIEVRRFCMRFDMLKGYRYFYVTNSVGYKIRDVVVLGDKTYRSLFEKGMILRTISYKKYMRDKRELYKCYDYLKEWLDLAQDKVYQYLKKELRKINRSNFENNLIDKRLKIYINTPYGNDLYELGKQIDKYFRVLFLGVKYSVMDVEICDENVAKFINLANSVIDQYKLIYKGI